jgi:hypothetical protein
VIEIDERVIGFGMGYGFVEEWLMMISKDDAWIVGYSRVKGVRPGEIEWLPGNWVSNQELNGGWLSELSTDQKIGR